MQILSSGSFVNLDNKEKIESLIFTAKEMANAAVETEGFVNEAENNKRLALEIWHGAEYMTRDHEEAQVKNIFVNNFLDSLRQINKAAKTAETISENTAGEVEAVNAEIESTPHEDEFLGLISTVEAEEKSADLPADTTDEQIVEIAVSEQNNSAASVEFETGETEIVEPAEESQAAIDEAVNEAIEVAESQSENAAETKEFSENNHSGEKPTENNRTTAKVPGAIVLPEKEPYRWEKCTVTATIQLLPTDDSDEAKRRAVLSVRTHDFAPQFSIVELSGVNILSELLPALEKSFETYKTDLPLKVMDKMKKEKSVTKKQSNKATVATKSSAANNSAADSQSKPNKNPTENVIAKTENAKPATTAATTVAPKPATVVPAESGQQGSLFGF